MSDFIHPLRASRSSPLSQGDKGGMPRGQRGALHATRRAECGGDSREDGDYDVEYFTPESVVVEGSHFVLD